MSDFYNDSRESPEFPSFAHVQVAGFCSPSFNEKTGWVKINDVREKLFDMVSEDDNGSKEWAKKMIENGLQSAIKNDILMEYDKKHAMIRVRRDN